MVANSLSLTAAARTHPEARAASVPRGKARVVDSCAGLKVGEYLWRVALYQNIMSIPQPRRTLYYLQRRKAHVPSGRIPAALGGFKTREAAEAECTTPFHFLFREPFECILESDAATLPDDYCRPLWDEHFELNEREREAFRHESDYYRRRECGEKVMQLEDEVIKLVSRVTRLEERRRTACASGK